MFCRAGSGDYDADLETVDDSGPARPKRKSSNEAAGPSRKRQISGRYISLSRATICHFQLLNFHLAKIVDFNYRFN